MRFLITLLLCSDTGLLNNIGNTKSSGVDRKSLDRSNERESSLLQRIRQNAGRTSPQKRDTQYAKDVNDEEMEVEEDSICHTSDEESENEEDSASIDIETFDDVIAKSNKEAEALEMSRRQILREIDILRWKHTDMRSEFNKYGAEKAAYNAKLAKLHERIDRMSTPKAN